VKVAEPPDGIHDVPGIAAGHWTDRDGLTGCTVVLAPPDGAVAAVSARGGAPGTRETDVLTPGNLVERAHAVLLTGGSAFGLAAATGVMRWLEEQGRGFETAGGRVPIVPAAVLYDLRSGAASARPDEHSGYAACVAATAANGAPLACGSWGAGTGATVAKIGGIERALKGGIGSASERLSGDVVVAALVAVNATGDIWDAKRGVPIAWPRADEHGQRPSALELLRTREPKQPAGSFNTTLTVIATNATLSRNDLLRVAEMTHAGLGRAIVPYLGPGDGDVVFALATGSVPRGDLTAIGALAGLAAARAVARGVRAAESLGGFPSVNATGEPAA
jgi:L-aminopeptidase/D-esterase-like protein